MMITDKTGQTHVVAKRIRVVRGVQRIFYKIPRAGQEPIATAVVDVHADAAVSMSQVVDPQYRRRGISTALKHLIAEDLRLPIRPYGDFERISAEGQAAWIKYWSEI